MALLPPRKLSTRDLIFQAIEAVQADGRRDHLGASTIGRECERALWYSFRWARTNRHHGRLLRLFETGQLEEARFVADLRRIGCTVMEVDPTTGRQWTVRDDTGHFGGSMDAVALGVPEAPKTWHLVEMKTHNSKSFKDLEAKGVALAKPEHFAQMQTYMHLGGLTRALYLAKNKDNDDLYSERIRYDVTTATRLLEKARRIVKSDVPPARISVDPTFWLCKWCDYSDLCHGGQIAERNCRTCLHASPVDDGAWRCEKTKQAMDSQDARRHYPCHRFIPDLVPMKQTDVRGDDVIYAGWVDNGN